MSPKLRQSRMHHIGILLSLSLGFISFLSVQKNGVCASEYRSNIETSTKRVLRGSKKSDKIDDDTNGKHEKNEKSRKGEKSDEIFKTEEESIHHKYVMITSDTCMAIGYTSINDFSSCLEAAGSLGIDVRTSEITSFRKQVNGCTIRFGNDIPFLAGSIGRNTHLIYNNVGSCDPGRGGVDCECSKTNPCICTRISDPPQSRHPTPTPALQASPTFTFNDLAESEDKFLDFTTTWSLDLKEKVFLLDDPLFKWAFEKEIKNWINKDIQCSGDVDLEGAEFHSVNFFSNRGQINRRRLLSGGYNNSTNIISNFTIGLNETTFFDPVETNGVLELESDPENDDHLELMHTPGFGRGRARGRCRESRCKASRKKTISDAGRRLNANHHICDNFHSSTILQMVKKNVFSASFFNYNLDVNAIDLLGDLDLEYSITFKEVNRDGLNTIDAISTTVEGDPLLEDHIICTTNQCTMQKKTMMELYQHFDVYENFNRHECSWQGVNCDDSNIVTQVWLEDYNFEAKTIPVSFGFLTSLTDLFLGSNGLVGKIPSELGLLTKLKTLWLRDNQLSGTIPDVLGNLQDLIQLNVHGNRLSGKIPSSIGKNRNLVLLDLGRNNLNGNIPSEFGQLSKLRTLTVVHNNLDGTIPMELSSLSDLHTLVLAKNKIRGVMPSQLGNLMDLAVLDLRSNHISGILPMTLKDLKQLKILNVFDNNLTGTIPTEVGILSNLVELVLDSNNLSGTLPLELGNLQVMNILSSRNNRLSGSIPSTIEELNSLRNLDISSNLLTGPIPTQLGAMPLLQFLSLHKNSLGGSIPSTLGNLLSLEILNLQDNSLSGTIPSEIGLLKHLRGLMLDNNTLTGTIPTELGNINQLEVLDVENNNFASAPAPGFMCEIDFIAYKVEGVNLDCSPTLSPEVITSTTTPTINVMPPPVNPMQHKSIVEVLTAMGVVVDTNQHECTWTGISCDPNYEIKEIKLEFSSLSGTIATHIGNLKTLQFIQLDSNVLVGTIPTEIGNLENLSYLALQGNRLRGQIPTEFGNLFNLQYVFLHDNRLKGKIPDLANLRELKTFYVPFNSLTGPLPLYWGSELSAFHVSYNDLTGTIPSQIGQSSKLQFLFVDHNKLVGTIPSEIGILHAGLKKLSLNANRFTGTIPSQIGQFVVTETIFLQENKLVGTIPPEIGNVSSLKYLSIHHNLLTGTLPSLEKLTKLQTLNIVGNNITGVGPDIVCDIPHVIYDAVEEIDCSK